jgi:hypothetical protein
MQRSNLHYLARTIMETTAMMSPYSNPDTSFSMLLFTFAGFDDCELVEVVTPVSVDCFLSDIVINPMLSTHTAHSL